MRSPQLSERGIALVVAVLALAVIGALVAGTFFVGRLEQQSGRGAMYIVQANQAAEAGLANALQVNPETYSGIAEGLEVQLANRVTVGPSRGSHYTLHARRLNASLFLVRSIGQRMAPDGSLLATGEHAIVIRLVKAQTEVNSVAVVRPIRQRPWMQLY